METLERSDLPSGAANRISKEKNMPLKPICAVLALYALAVALTPPTMAHAGAKDDTRDVLEANYARLAKAWERKDVPTLAPLLTPFYRENGHRGKPVTPAQALRLVQEDFRHIDTVQVHATRIQSLQIVGKRAVVTVDTSLTLSAAEGQEPPQQRLVKLLFRDTWSRSGGRWTLLGRKPLKGMSTVDRRTLLRYDVSRKAIAK